jgi:hypothetical protein
MTSQSEIFKIVKDTYPMLELHHSSGGLPDVKGKFTSDVDISCPHPNALEIIDLFPANSLIETTQEYTIVSLLGFKRPVNIYISPNPLDAVKHRQLELYLNLDFPDLVGQVYALKRYAGKTTEEAWCAVVGADVSRCYEMMLDSKEIIRLAAIRNDEWHMYQFELVQLSQISNDQ